MIKHVVLVAVNAVRNTQSSYNLIAKHTLEKKMSGVDSASGSEVVDIGDKRRE